MLKRYIIKKAQTAETLGSVEEICANTKYTQKDLLELNRCGEINFIYKNKNVHGSKCKLLLKERKILKYKFFYCLSPLELQKRLIKDFLKSYCLQKLYFVLYFIFLFYSIFCVYSYHAAWYEYLGAILISALAVHSIALHELGHIVACNLCNAEYKIIISGLEVSVYSRADSYKKNIIIAASGAGVNLLIAAVIGILLLVDMGLQYTFMLKVCCMIHLLNLSNLLPMFTDGKNIMEYLKCCIIKRSEYNEK